ncbi:MAG: ParB/RepB/Spo0J family partition protein [Opitutales bacterium]
MATQKKRLGRGLGSIISGGASQTAAPAETETAPRKSATRKPAAKSKKTAPKAAKGAKPPILKEPQPADAPAVQPDTGSNGVLPYREIPVEQISKSPYQPRREISLEKVAELAESIRSEGQLQPIVVREFEGGYQLIAGERRWRAHQHLGLAKISARIIEATDASAAVISLIENLQREQLNPIEESLGLASLMRDFDLTQEAVAERVGRPRASVANSLRLLNLDRQTQGFVARGLLSAGHAKVLLGLEDEAQRHLLAQRIVEDGLSVRQTEDWVRKMKAERGAGRGAANGSNGLSESEQVVLRDLEKRIGSTLKTKVTLKHTARKGRLVIEYRGNEDLERILEHLGVRS